MSEQRRSGEGTKSKSRAAYGKNTGYKKSSQPHSKASAKHTWDKQVARTSSKRENADELQAGDVIVVTIKRLGINGEGVGYYRRKAVFIDGAITDEVVKAEVKEVQAKFIKARLLEVEKRSRYRIEPPCPVFGICGGCQIQHISYEANYRPRRI
ncbi:RNA methyltransferase, TrmA family [Paenibacillus sp. JCM 10914]|nr:RNA methyltransferase, TrmA family [Paenibacillus sp. JCM 10914]